MAIPCICAWMAWNTSMRLPAPAEAATDPLAADVLLPGLLLLLLLGRQGPSVGLACKQLQFAEVAQDLLPPVLTALHWLYGFRPCLDTCALCRLWQADRRIPDARGAHP